VEETALKTVLVRLIIVALLPTVGCQIYAGNPSLDGDSVILHATTGPRALDSLFFGYPAYEAIYLASATCQGPVADNSNTSIPGGTGIFGSFGNTLITDPVVGTSVFFHGEPSFDAGTVAFRGHGGGFGEPRQAGIYLIEGASLSVIADLDTPIPCSTPPCGAGNFTGFGPSNFYCTLIGPPCRALPSPSLHAGRVAFYGLGSQGDGIYLDDGPSLRVVVDRSTPGPGGISLDVDDRGIFSLDEGNVAFVAGTQSTGNQGIYLHDGNTIVVVADRNTPIPGGTGNFDDFEDVSADGGKVAFVAASGIYLYDGTSLSALADRNTPIPGGTGNFNGFRDVSADGGGVAFVAASGIYLHDGASLSVVADRHTPIPGGIGNFASFGGVSADGSNIAFAGGGPIPGFPLGLFYEHGIYLHDGHAPRVILPPGAFFNLQRCHTSTHSRRP
jgi:hypothetical protein